MPVEFIRYLGYPKKLGHPHYALYQPLLNCFLLVTDNKDQAVTVKNLAITRYPLFVVDLSKAKNYQFNLIDNVCCQQWTASFDTHIDFTEINNVSSLTPINLVRSNSLENFGIDLEKEKQWLQYLWYWTRFIDHIPGHFIKWHEQKLLIREVIPQAFADYDQEFSQVAHYISNIKRILFFSRDVSECHNQILSYMDFNPELKKFYQHWHKLALLAIEKHNVY